jgi:quercetin dioxygenase-like cupin family protein
MARFAALLGLTAIAFLNVTAQDPITVDSRIAKVEYEDARIRVLRVHYAPQQALGMHDHPARAGLCLTACDMLITAPDGSKAPVKSPAGEWFWTEPTRHATRNNSDKPMETIEVEFRKAGSPAAPVALAANGATPQEPVPVETEPFHRPVYQNQYVRILDVAFQPTQTTLLHTHSHDYLAVHLSDTTIQIQPEGKDWAPATMTHFGAVQMNLFAGKPLTHRVRNVGSSKFHVMVFEILQ